MPRKFAKNHDEALKKFQRTGKSKVVGVAGRRLQGLHKNGMVMPLTVESTSNVNTLISSLLHATVFDHPFFPFPFLSSLTAVDVVQVGRSTVYSGKLMELTDASGVMTIDDQGIIQSCNKALLALFGFQAQNDLVGRNVSRLMPGTLFPDT